jgi:hypothetical protein
MNSNDLTTNDQPQPKPSAVVDHRFRSIDGYHTGYASFVLCMLRLGRAITGKEAEKFNLSATQVSRLIKRHWPILQCYYSGMDIRKQLWTNSLEMTGGGIQVEAYEVSHGHRRNDPPHFSITFKRVYPEADLIPALNEPV